MAGEGKPDPFWARARLLVIDNVASLVYPEMEGGGRVSGDGMKEISGRVEVAVGALQRLSSEHRMCVLIRVGSACSTYGRFEYISEILIKNAIF